MDECLDKISTPITFESRQNDYGSYYNYNLLLPELYRPYYETNKKTTTCESAEPIAAGNRCCVGQHKDVAHNLYPNYFLSCKRSRKSEASATGTWTWKRCPEYKIFDESSMTCVYKEAKTMPTAKKNSISAAAAAAAVNRPAFPTCPDKSIAQGFCVNGRCPKGLTCINGDANYCGGQSSADSSCFTDRDCATGYICNIDVGRCCNEPSTPADTSPWVTKAQQICSGTFTVGLAVVGCNKEKQCPPGYACRLSICCPENYRVRAVVSLLEPVSIISVAMVFFVMLEACAAVEQDFVQTVDNLLESASMDNAAMVCSVAQATSAAGVQDFVRMEASQLGFVPMDSAEMVLFAVPATCAVAVKAFARVVAKQLDCASMGSAEMVCFAVPATYAVVVKVRTCSDGLEPAGLCSNGQCGPGYECTSGNLCCPIGPNGLCPSGWEATGRCVNNQCGGTAVCYQGQVCCQRRGQTTCPDGSPLLAYCINGSCGRNLVCVGNTICCPSSSLIGKCADGTEAAGLCVNGNCGGGLICNRNNLCCPSTWTQGGFGQFGSNSLGPSSLFTGPAGLGSATNSGVISGKYSFCPNGMKSDSSCVEQTCRPGFYCTPENQCCPRGSILTSEICPDGRQVAGACINGRCGNGLVCIEESNTCCYGGTQPNIRCPDGRKPINGCLSGLCAIGYECTAQDFCCESTTPPAKNVCPDGSTAVEACTSDYRCSNKNLVCIDGFNCCRNMSKTCPSGYVTEGPCLDGLCPQRYTCLDGLCCSLVGDVSKYTKFNHGMFDSDRNQPADKGPDSSCSQPNDCYGARSKLATCYKGVCTCLPGATKVGNMCIARPTDSLADIWASSLNDSPDIDTETNLDWKPCNVTSECSVMDHEKCIQHACIAPKAPGESCSETLECQLNCRLSQCVGLKGKKLCVCAEPLFVYKRRCMNNCPKGTEVAVNTTVCEDTTESLMIQDTVGFGSDVQKSSAC
ncbi:unnamed protein product [Soboliphyme baturini]|uniref:Chitin-binding type-2 domain-containing protein n=1 Tax=Soboliphyme baturini TaxID=241478 RepID=A0A183IFP3_9BILA|nr:unnamed protein product [Soboliphyme baturini]